MNATRAHDCRSVAALAPSLALRFCGLELSSPIVLLSGCVGFGEEYTRVEGFSNRDAGAIVLKGTTASAAARQRTAPSLRNPRRHAQRDRPAESRRRLRGEAGSCRGSTSARRASSPTSAARPSRNTSRSRAASTTRASMRSRSTSRVPTSRRAGSQFGNVPEMSARVVEACRRVTGKPLITKLSPNQTDIRENARRCIEAGTDAFAVINTVTGMAVDVASAPPGTRQRPGRPVGPGDQADRAAQGAARSTRSPAPKRHSDHRPGRHRQRAGCARVHHRRRQRRSVWAPRCSTIRCCARASTRGWRNTWTRRR